MQSQPTRKNYRFITEFGRRSKLQWKEDSDNSRLHQIGSSCLTLNVYCSPMNPHVCSENCCFKDLKASVYNCLYFKNWYEYWIESPPKLEEARSLLYRSRFLQPNTHSSAFFEIYKICKPLHRSNFKNWATVRETLSDFCSRFCKKSLFFKVFHRILRRFWSKFHGISPIILKNDERSTICWISNGF